MTSLVLFGCCSTVSKELSLIFFWHTRARTHTATQGHRAGVLRPTLMMNHLAWASGGCRWWSVVILALCLTSLCVLFVCPFNLYLSKRCVSTVFVHIWTLTLILTTTNTKLLLAPPNRLCHGHKSPPPHTIGLACVFFFSPCVYSWRQTIYFLQESCFPGAHPWGQLCIQRNIPVCRGATLHAHIYI